MTGILARTLGVVVLPTSALLWAPAPALASCVAEPATSPDAFLGTVVDTRHPGRVAEVVRDDGCRVTVHGSPAEGHAATSVDRSFVIGGRYEFHPRNATSPFQDNACTATHQIAGPTAVPESDDGTDAGLLGAVPTWLPVDEELSLGSATMVLGAATFGVGLTLVVQRVRRV